MVIQSDATTDLRTRVTFPEESCVFSRNINLKQVALHNRRSIRSLTREIFTVGRTQECLRKVQVKEPGRALVVIQPDDHKVYADLTRDLPKVQWEIKSVGDGLYRCAVTPALMLASKGARQLTLLLAFQRWKVYGCA